METSICAYVLQILLRGQVTLERGLLIDVLFIHITIINNIILHIFRTNSRRLTMSLMCKMRHRPPMHDAAKTDGEMADV